MDEVITVISTPLYEAGLHQKTMYIALRDNATDAAPELRPLQPVPNDNAEGIVDFYQEADGKLDRLWKTKLGRHLYDHVVKEDLKKEGIRLPYSPDKVMLVSLPKHYTLWVHKKGNPADPRQDTYLHGSRFVNKFRSPAEFCNHLKWLLDGQPTNARGKRACGCCYCDGSRPQGEISKGFGAYHKRGRQGGGRSRGEGRTRAQETPIVVYKDYRKW